MALAAYRHVLRGIRTAFQNDTPLLTRARHQARADFQSHRALDANSAHVRERVQHAEQVALLLTHNVVQGARIDGAEDGQDMKDRELGAGRRDDQRTGGEYGEKWRLNIHAKTELGDNDSVKTSRGRPVVDDAAGLYCGNLGKKSARVERQ